MADLTAQIWRDWVAAVAEPLGVAPDEVDVDFIHALTQVVAHEFDRPMAPVSAYVLGLAAGLHPDRTPAELREAIVGVVRSGESRLNAG